jgi:hypothetical protein
MSQLNDTSPEAERVLIEAARKMSVARKWRQMGEIYHTARVLHAAGVRLRNPAASDQDIHDAWMAATLGPSLSEMVKEARNGHRIDR